MDDRGRNYHQRLRQPVEKNLFIQAFRHLDATAHVYQLVYTLGTCIFVYVLLDEIGWQINSAKFPGLAAKEEK